MDFAIPYTEEQEQFRKEVRVWLEENSPENMRIPVDGNYVTAEMRAFWTEKQQWPKCLYTF